MMARVTLRVRPSPPPLAWARRTSPCRRLPTWPKDKTVHFYAPTLKLGAEVVANAQAIGLDAVLLRGREENQGDPDLWPALCQKVDVAARTRPHRPQRLEQPLPKDGCDPVTKRVRVYVAQFKGLEGKLIGGRTKGKERGGGGRRTRWP